MNLSEVYVAKSTESLTEAHRQEVVGSALEDARMQQAVACVITEARSHYPDRLASF